MAQDTTDRQDSGMDTQERIFYAATTQAVYMLSLADSLEQVAERMAEVLKAERSDVIMVLKAAVELRWLAQK
jgi:hypothetical protein